MADGFPAQVRIQLLSVQGRQQQSIFDVVLKGLCGQRFHDEASQTAALVARFGDDPVKYSGITHHIDAAAGSHVVATPDHGMVHSVHLGGLEPEVIIGKPGILRVLGLHVNEHHGLRRRGDVQPVLLGQETVPGGVVGENRDDPGWGFRCLGHQLGEFGMGGIMGEVDPVPVGVGSKDRREAALVAGLVAPAAGPAGYPDFQQVGDVFNHGVRSHVMRVFQRCHKQQG